MTMPSGGQAKQTTPSEEDTHLVTNDASSHQVLGEMSEESGNLTFVSDAIVSSLKERPGYGSSFSALSWYNPRGKETMEEFLARPYLVSQGSFLTTNGRLTGSFTINSLLNSNVHLEKLRGYVGLRATVHIKITANVSNFTQGILTLFYVPTPSLISRSATDRLDSLTRVTQLPHVNMDLSCETEMELQIPYISPYPYHNMVAGTAGSFFEAYLWQYAPVATGTGTTTTGTWSAYMWLTDVELVTMFRAQSGGKPIKKLNPTEVEKKEGPVSQVLSKGIKTATILNKIPILSSIAGSAAWAMGLMKDVASVWGYSKPRIEDPPNRVVRYCDPYFGNVDGNSTALSLGASVSTGVGIEPLAFGKDLDEMSLNYVASKYSYCATFDITTSNGDGTLLYSMSLSPWTFPAAGVVSPVTNSTHEPGFFIDPTSFGFVSSFFRAYHGGVKLKIHFVKTKYHSARVKVVFAPGRINSTTMTNDSAFYRTILDLREANQFEIEIPYVLPVPFVTRKNNTMDLYGMVYFYLEDRLNCPDSVSQTINAYVEIAAGDDATWAIPTKSEFTLTSSIGSLGIGTYRSRNAISAYPTNVFDQFGTQSGGCAVKKLDFGVKNTSDKTYLLQYCVGEQISSFKQLLSIPDYCQWRVASVPPGVGTMFDPFHIWAVDYVDDTNLRASTENIGEDTYSLLSSAYAFSVGGVNIMVHNQTQQLDPSGYLQLEHGNLATSSSSLNWLTPSLPYPQTDFFSSTQLFNPSVAFANRAYLNDSRSITAYVPSYVTLPCRANTPGWTQTASTSRNQVSLTFYSRNGGAADSNRWLFARSLAEDGRLGFYLGAPRILLDILSN